MKQIIFSVLAALLLSGFFVEQAFAQGHSVTGTNGGIAGDGTKGGVGGTGGNGTSGNTINGNNGTDANGHSGISGGD
jgi:hypothetical protein